MAAADGMTPDEEELKALPYIEVPQFCSCSSHKWPDLEPKIGQLINSSSKGFIVYLDKKNEYDWHCTSEFETALDEKDAKNGGKFGAIHNRAILLSSLPTKHLAPDEKRQFQVMLGQAIGCGLDGDIANGETMLDVAAEYRSECNLRVAHLWFLTSSMIVALMVALIVLIIWLLRDYTEGFFGPTLFLLILGSAAGSLGALLSIILRLSLSNADPSSGKALHFLEGASRILAGVLGAIVVGLAFQMGLLLSTFKSANQAVPALILACLVAGASERLVPSFIKKFDSEVDASAAPKKL